MMRFRSVFILIVLLSLGSDLEAQIYVETERKVADSLMLELKDGALVVRLKTYHDKISALEQSLNNPSTSQKEKKRIKKSINNIISDRDRYNKELTNAFYDFYDFSEFYVAYDTSFHKLNNGVKQGYFLNKNLEIDESIALQKSSYFIIGEGIAKADNQVPLTGLVVMNSQSEQLDRPFPRFFMIRSRKAASFIKAFLGTHQYNRRPGEEIVKKINSNFSSF